VGVALTTGLVFGMIAVMKRLVATGALAWEPEWELRTIERSGLTVSDGIWFQTLGTDITLWFVIFTFAGISAWNRRPLWALSVILAFLGVDLLVRLAWASWPRPRPDLVLGGAVAPGFASFPSGHTGKTLAVYGFLAYLWWSASRSWIERTLAVLIVAAFVVVTAGGRMLLGAHWPSDLVGGATLGAFWLAVLIVALRVSGAESDRGSLGASRSAERAD
jgi:membrane-associated phospholipid phosphatase